MAASINRAYVKKLASDIEESIEAILRYTSKPYESMSEAERYAVRYNIIVIAEAIAALAIHTARRLCGEEPETTQHALSILRGRGLLTEVEYENLARLIRLRNLLLHRYWTIDDERIYASMLSERYKYYRLDLKEKEAVKEAVREVLEEGGVELAIIFGSFVELESFRDIDVAVYASSRELDLDAVIKLSVKLEESLRIPVDVVPLDEVSPSFRHYILTKGDVVLEKRPGLYEALLMRTLDELEVLESEETVV